MRSQGKNEVSYGNVDKTMAVVAGLVGPGLFFVYGNRLAPVGQQGGDPTTVVHPQLLTHDEARAGAKGLRPTPLNPHAAAGGSS